MAKAKGYTKQTFESRADWLKARGFGGSTASAILGCNPWLTQFDLYTSFYRGSEDNGQNEAMAYGTEAEHLIRELYALDGKYLGFKVLGPGYKHAMYRRKDKPYLTATIDGSIVMDDGTKGILEIKTHDIRGRADEEQWAEGKLPQNYYVQCLHYLAVLDDMAFVELVAKLRYFDYDGEKRTLSKTEIRYYHIDRKEKQAEIDYLEKKETAFYGKLKEGEPPDVTITFD